MLHASLQTPPKIREIRPDGSSLQPCKHCDSFGEHTRRMDAAITPTKPKKGKVEEVFFPPP